MQTAQSQTSRSEWGSAGEPELGGEGKQERWGRRGHVIEAGAQKYSLDLNIYFSFQSDDNDPSGEEESSSGRDPQVWPIDMHFWIDWQW